MSLGDPVVGTTTRRSRISEIEATGAEARLLRFDDLEPLRGLLRTCQRVFFCAAPARGGSYQSVYFDGMKAVLDALDWSSTELLAFTSSTQVYGQDDGSEVDEQSPAEPGGAGGRVLRATEELLLQRTAEEPARGLVLRLAGIWGPGRDPLSWLQRSGGQLSGSGSAYLNLVHRDDIVAALVVASQSKIEGIINVAGPVAETRRDFFGRLATAHDLPAPCFAAGEGFGPERRGKQVLAVVLTDLLGRSLRPGPGR